jgi:hypothetical protein
MPTLRQYDAAGRLLPAGADPAKIARSEYEIHIRPGIRYQPHPRLCHRRQRASRPDRTDRWTSAAWAIFRTPAPAS